MGNSIFDFLFRRGTQNTGNEGGNITLLGGGGKITNSGEIVSAYDALRDASVLTCINIIAQGIAQLPVRGSLEDLFNKPNEYQTQYDFMYSLIHSLLAYGNAYVRVERSGDRPTRLIPLDPSKVSVSSNPAGYPVYVLTGQEERIDYKDMIHIKDINTFDVGGQSRVELASERIGALKAADRRIANTFKNGIQIDRVITMDKSMDASKLKQLTSSLSEVFGREGTSAGGTIVLENGRMDTAKGSTPADTDLRDLRSTLIREVAAMFRVPSSMVDGTSDSKYSNLRQQQTSLYRDTLAPLIVSITQAFNARLEGAGMYFDIEDLLKGDQESQTRVATQAYMGGLITVNEARKWMGLDDIAGEDSLKEDPATMDPDDDRGSTDSPDGMRPEKDPANGDNDGQ